MWLSRPTGPSSPPTRLARTPAGPPGINGGGGGGAGGQGHNGRNVAITAALAAVGSLTVVTDGGTGGQGGVGFWGGSGSNGGQGGPGGAGGDAGQIAHTWLRAAKGLPTTSGTAPNGHVYSSKGGAGGNGGPGGPGGSGCWLSQSGSSGPPGAAGPGGKTPAPKVVWRADLDLLLWAQAQDIGPAARSGHGLAVDPTRGKLVLFGGLAGGAAVGDTWEWDGKLWSQVADTGPSPRFYHGMAYDPAGGRVVVFGGASDPAGAGRHFNDTWGWDGEAWIQLADTGPSARQAPAMAADPVRQRVALFSGGQTGATAAFLPPRIPGSGTGPTGLNWPTPAQRRASTPA